CLLGVGLLAARELLLLLDPASRPRPAVYYPAIALALAANWWVPLRERLPSAPAFDVWHVLGLVCLGTFVAALLVEMYCFREPGGLVNRVALTLFAVVYLGVLPSFLAQLRWVSADPDRTTLAFALTVFVPKCGDMAAYFTGTFVGRHRMTPLLSPKK